MYEYKTEILSTGIKWFSDKADEDGNNKEKLAAYER